MADDLGKDDLITTDPDDSDGEECSGEFAFERVMKALFERDKQDRDLVMKSQFSDLHGSIRGVDLKVGIIGERVDLANSRIGAMENRFERMEGCVDTVVDHYHAQASKVGALDQQVAVLNKTLSSEHKTLNQLAQEQRNMKSEYNGDLRMLNNSVSEMKEVVDENGGTMKELANNVNALAGKAGVLHARFATTWKAIVIASGILIAALSGVAAAAIWAAKHWRILPLICCVALSSGCTSSSLRTATVLNVESKYRTGVTVQQCGHADELIPLVEKAWPIILDEMVAVGLVEDRAALEKKAKGARVCLLEEPDLCGPLSTKCIGIPQCARKRGCADAWGLFIRVSRWWPPICRGAWPTEPHCVAEGQPRSADYKKDLVAEMGNFIYQASEHKDNYHGADAVLKAITAAIKRLGW